MPNCEKNYTIKYVCLSKNFDVMDEMFSNKLSRRGLNVHFLDIFWIFFAQTHTFFSLVYNNSGGQSYTRKPNKVDHGWLWLACVRAMVISPKTPLAYAGVIFITIRGSLGYSKKVLDTLRRDYAPSFHIDTPDHITP